MSKVIYRHVLQDGNETLRAEAFITETSNEAYINGNVYVVSFKGKDSGVDNYDTFETYDGALVAALEFILDQTLFYTDLTSTVDYGGVSGD